MTVFTVSDGILIGTRGWEQPEWARDYYPPELPADWRFCYYSNRLRSVLVPGDIGRDAGAQAVAQWVEDSDPQFRFVFELPPQWQALSPGALGDAFDRFRDITAVAHPRIAGLVVRAVGAPEPGWLEALFEAAGDFRPLSVDLPVARRTAELEAVCAGRLAGWCWRCAEEEAPASAGRLVVALSGAVPPRVLRRILGQLDRARGPDRGAALFFEGEQAIKAAEEARIVAELMAV